jgi:hypothetical protein
MLLLLAEIPHLSGCSLGVEASLLGGAWLPAQWLAATAEEFQAAQAREVAQRQTLEARAGTTHVALLGTQVPAALGHLMPCATDTTCLRHDCQAVICVCNIHNGVGILTVACTPRPGL